ncbi:MAG: hypothetical protein QME42_01565 [bacterium]|nr:hypothetical protein [bacterium]
MGDKNLSVIDVLSEIGMGLMSTQNQLIDYARKQNLSYVQNIAEAEIELKTLFNVKTVENKSRLGMVLFNSYARHTLEMEESTSSKIKVTFSTVSMQRSPEKKTD